MARRSLADILPKLIRPRWRSIHEVVRIADGFICLESECAFVTRDLAEVAGHVARNQYVVQTKENEQ